MPTNATIHDRAASAFASPLTKGGPGGVFCESPSNHNAFITPPEGSFKRWQSLAITTTLLITLASPLQAEDWRQFRGNETTAVAATAPPTSWSADENIAWKADLPGRGLSSPIIVDGRVIITACSGYRQDRLHVLCFDSASGMRIWERQFLATGNTTSHPKTSTASSSPASDGERVFAVFSSNDVACLDLNGNLLWYRGLTFDNPTVSNSLGMASSPVVVNDTLVVQTESDNEAFAFGLNVETGESRWKIPRPQRANWTSPVILGEGDDRLVLLQSSAGIDAVDPQSGKVVWSYKDGASTIPSSAVAGDTVYVPSHGLTALRAPAGSSNPEMLWRVGKLGPATASPLVIDGRVYSLNSAGVLSCGELTEGKLLWQLRVKGPFTASPVAAGGHLFLFNEEGQGQVVKLGEETGELVSENPLGETILSTPAIADGALYVRSDGHLWKVGATR